MKKIILEAVPCFRNLKQLTKYQDANKFCYSIKVEGTVKLTVALISTVSESITKNETEM